MFSDFIHFNIDVDFQLMKDKYPALVPEEFFVIRKDYGRNGILTNYWISRLVTDLDELVRRNDFECLFIELNDEAEGLVRNLCNGHLKLHEITLLSASYGHSEISLFEVLRKLTKLRVIFWADSPSHIDQFKKSLLQRYTATPLPGEILYTYIYNCYGIPYMFAPTKFSFVVTDKCNAKCKTCYRGTISFNKEAKYQDELSTQELIQTLQYLRSIGTDRIKFLGGEPLCRQDIFTLIDFANRQNMITELSSNGLLLADDKYIQEVASLNPCLSNIQISIDGMEYGQNTQRTGADFYTVVKAFEKMKRAGLNFTTNTIVSRVNMSEIDELIKMIAEFGVEGRFQIMKACGIGQENFSLIPSPAEKKQIISIINTAAAKYGARIKNAVIFHPFVSAKNQSQSNKKAKYHRCRACTYGMALSPQGYALPCEFLEPFHEFQDFNIKEHSILDIWHTSSIFQKLRTVEVQGKCAICEYSGRCEMGCFAETYGLTGQIDAPDPVCWYQCDENVYYPESNDYIVANCKMV